MERPLNTIQRKEIRDVDMPQKELRNIRYDRELGIEAYRFKGVLQPFPNHFHDHYTIGFIKDGRRTMTCRGREYHVSKGDVILLQPQQNHACLPYRDSPLHFYGLNVVPQVMADLTEEAAGRPFQPSFTTPAIKDPEAAETIFRLNEMIFDGVQDPQKEDLLLELTALLMAHCRDESEAPDGNPFDEIAEACRYMEAHFDEHISLDDLCGVAAMSKSTLLRAFTREKGITPYRYLETLRINRAKELLAAGATPVEAAAATGFTDQSHFNRYFTRFIGLSPGMYRDIFRK